MNYALDEEEKQLLQLLESVNDSNNFVEKNAFATESIHAYSVFFDHNDVRCSIMINKKGRLQFKAGNYFIFFERTYRTCTTKWFDFIKTYHMDYNHPLIKAGLKTHKLIMQAAKAVDKQKQEKIWKNLLNS